MTRFLILLLGMLTTRTGKVPAPRLRAEDDSEPLGSGAVGRDPEDTWIVAREPLPPTRRQRGEDGTGSRRPDRIPAARRRRVPRWLKWAALLALAGLIFRKAVAFVALAVLSAALHLIGLNVHLPSIKFGWPWQSIAAGTTTDTDVGPWVLQKIEGISRPALGTENFNFVFTHKVSKSIGLWPCWYSSTFYAVGRASATVDLNPGPGWWAPAAGHYQLKVLGRPAGGKPGRVTVTIVLPPPQLPGSVHDITVDNTLSHVAQHRSQLDLPRIRLRSAAEAAVLPRGALRAGPDARLLPGDKESPGHPANDQRGGKRGGADHPGQLHPADGQLARLHAGGLQPALVGFGLAPGGMIKAGSWSRRCSV